MIAGNAGLQPVLSPLYFTITFDHAWSQAYINNTWVDLDASWKSRDYQTGHTDLVDPTSSTFNESTYLSTVRNETGEEYFEQQLRSYLGANCPTISVNDIPHTGPIHQQSISAFAPSLPYSHSTPTTNASIPSGKLHQVTVQVLDAGGTTQYLTWTGTLSQMSLDRLTICPVAAGGNVTPKLYDNGVVVATSTHIFAPTDNMTIKITHTGPGVTEPPNSYQRPAGKYIAIGIDAHQTSEQSIATIRGQVNDQMLAKLNSGSIANKEAFYGGLMQLGAMSYFQDTTAGKQSHCGAYRLTDCLQLGRIGVNDLRRDAPAAKSRSAVPLPATDDGHRCPEHVRRHHPDQWP